MKVDIPSESYKGKDKTPMYDQSGPMSVTLRPTMPKEVHIALLATPEGYVGLVENNGVEEEDVIDDTH
ncbi:hypothetical protein A0J61_06050 [Choanephora cucurbitarum]|uniref:Uncharacterized protein n=1 Tax=Choanephora cucurbitarum TaxID=101091 RepID=A0A1C7NF01_9FUNG|nr:hypothetical protein A0J61_06050 [Choanephora cucurbitarum]